MKLYKSPSNDIYAYELDGSQDSLIPSEFVAITAEEAEAIKTSKEQAIFEALPYSVKRSAEYPPMSDYLDAIVKGDQAQMDKYIADCLAVKAKYPKGTA